MTKRLFVLRVEPKLREEIGRIADKIGESKAYTCNYALRLGLPKIASPRDIPPPGDKRLSVRWDILDLGEAARLAPKFGQFGIAGVVRAGLTLGLRELDI